MSNITFENYGVLAESIADYTQVAGRYSCQKEDEKNILQDVIRKLALSADVSLLEIGCGTGNLLIPLSFFVHRITGIDHINCVKALTERYKDKNFVLIGENFLNCSEKQLGLYDRILIYSVLHCLGQDEVELFIDKAITLLEPGGKMLLGDIPNISKKRRFLTSNKGKLFVKDWDKKLAKTGNSTQRTVKHEDLDIAKFDDARLLSLLRSIREAGCDAYLLPQPVNLPFGYTREDVLIEKPA